MMSENKLFMLGDLIDSISITHSLDKDEIILINTSDVLTGKVLNHKYQKNENLKGQFKKSFKRNDILFSEIRPKNKRFAYVDFNANDYVASTKLMVLRKISDEIDNKYLYLLLTNKSMLDYLQMLAESRSGTFPQITFSHLSNIQVSLPSLPVQRRIAAILSSLDDKIENNRKTCEKLEEMAQAIFKRWFVEFEFPNEEGKPYKSSGGEMVYCEELGKEIPKEWIASKLTDVMKLSTTSVKPFNQPNELFEHYSIPAYDEKHLPTFDLGSTIKSNKYKVDNNSILISKLNPTTKRIWYPLNLTNNAICSTEFLNYIPYESNDRAFCYELINSYLFNNYLLNHVTGSTGSRQRVRPKDTLEFKFAQACEDMLKKFCNLVTPIHDKINTFLLEVQSLQNTRDALLPKLINGEIDLENKTGGIK